MGHPSTIILLASYLMMLLIVGLTKSIKPGLISYQNPSPTDLNLLSLMHLILICVMLLPMWFISSVPYSLLQFTLRDNEKQLFALLTCLLLIICLPRKEQSFLKQPSFTWHPSRLSVVLYSASRIAFLVSYEWFLRGLLLIESYRLVGFVNAVVINILLYALAHFHKDRKEIIGCIPFGLLLCAFTILAKSIWPAVIIHLFLAIRYEWRPIYHFITPQKTPAL